MKNIKLFIFSLLCLFSLNSVAQKTNPKTTYHSPLGIPIYLSGTFAEPRANHFHSGIDIRTANKAGYKVYAIDEGFVSRIAVSPGGFGKAIYIDHPDGHTSVYAHLQEFEGDIAAYVKKQQYRQERFEVNLLPEKNLLKVSKGQWIALSGNSGSSEGPHLHFELRDTPTQEILNPLVLGFTVKDQIKPDISRVVLYPIGDQSMANGSTKRSLLPDIAQKKNEKATNPLLIEASGLLAFGISTSDRMNEVPNTNGVASITLDINGNTFWELQTDRFSFDETRYINSLIDYGFYKQFNSRVFRTEVDPRNKLRLYGKVQNKGVLKVDEGKTYEARYTVKDFNGNTSVINFIIKGKAVQKTVQTMQSDTALWVVKAGQIAETENKRFFIRFEENSFYRDEALRVSSVQNKEFLSTVVQIGPDDIPVHQSFTLGIKPLVNKIDPSKLLIVSLEKDKKPSAVGGTYEKGFVQTKVRSIGNFAILADTLPPVVKALNFSNGTAVQALKLLKIEISDELSGIASYRASLNGNWILMDYDAKNKLLVYQFDEKLTRGKNVLSVKVTDACGNVKTLTFNLIY